MNTQMSYHKRELNLYKSDLGNKLMDNLISNILLIEGLIYKLKSPKPNSWKILWKHMWYFVKTIFSNFLIPLEIPGQPLMKPDSRVVSWRLNYLNSLPWFLGSLCVLFFMHHSLVASIWNINQLFEQTCSRWARR